MEEHYISPVITLLKKFQGKSLADGVEPIRLPDENFICQKCPKAMWHASADNLKCYCKVMMTMQWTTADRSEDIFCDEQQEAEREWLEAKAKREAEAK